MDNRDIVVVGASAGGLAALQALLPALPRELPAALFLIVHGGGHKAALDHISPLEVEMAQDGAPMRASRLYLAPTNQHLVISDGRMHHRRGPRENLARPSIDVLFRSAAVELGPRVIGVLLSGTLFDGAAGLRAISRCGGVSVVQEPADALFAEMPEHAIATSQPDHCVPAAAIGELLKELVAAEPGPSPEVPRDLRLEAWIHNHPTADKEAAWVGELSPFTCPECGGSLREIGGGGIPHYRCHVGHAYGGDLLVGAQSEVIERALWSALKAHEERQMLLGRLAAQARAGARSATAARWEQAAAEHEEHAQAIRRLLAGERPSARAAARQSVTEAIEAPIA